MHLKRYLVKRFVGAWPALLALGVALVAGSPSRAAEDTRFSPAKRPAKTAESVAAAPSRVNVRVISIPQECPADDNEAMNAVKAFIDPATGELRAPTPEEAAALARAIAPGAARQAQAARVPVVRANGIVSIEVGEEGMQDLVVRTGADGKPVFSCTPRSETPKALTRPLTQNGDAAREEK